jgi:phosphoglycolate phosphatase-like HAD superfamily hydrolase
MHAMRLEGLVFDLDGTLADTLPVCFHACRTVFASFLGRSFTDGEIAELFGPSEVGIIRRLVPDRWQDALVRYLAEYQDAHARFACTIPGIEEVLRLAQDRGTRLAVVTGKGTESTRISLGLLGLARYFDCVETGSAEGGIKAFSLRQVLARWAVPPEAVAYVGDAPTDVLAAKEAGVLSVAAAWAAGADSALLSSYQPRFLFTTVGEFSDWVRAQFEIRR